MRLKAIIRWRTLMDCEFNNNDRIISVKRKLKLLVLKLSESAGERARWKTLATIRGSE